MMSLSTNDYYEIVCRQEGTSGSAYLTNGDAEGISWTSIELVRH